jgi:hypothetical protein
MKVRMHPQQRQPLDKTAVDRPITNSSSNNKHGNNTSKMPKINSQSSRHPEILRGPVVQNGEGEEVAELLHSVVEVLVDLLGVVVRLTGLPGNH